MSIKVESEKDNQLMGRRECWLILEHAGKATPSRAELLKEASKALESNEELTSIEKILSMRGLGKSKVKIFAYSSKERMPKKEEPKAAQATAEGSEKKEGAK